MTTTSGDTNLTVFVGDGSGNFQGNVLRADLVVSIIVFLSIDGKVPIENHLPLLKLECLSG